MKVRFLVFADLHYHLFEREDGDRRIAQLIEAIKDNNPDFCVSLGDFCEPLEENKRLLTKFRSLGIPFYMTVGNHESDAHGLSDILEFWQDTPEYYSFAFGDYKFIVLNTCYGDFNGEEKLFYKHNFREQGTIYPIIPQKQSEWLEKELSDNKKHIIMSHHGFFNNFPNRAVKDKEWYQKLFEENNVILSLNGHDHGDAMEEKNGILYYCVNSASYVWLGSKIAESPELQAKYGHLQGMVHYKEPLYVTVEIDDSKILIRGTDSSYEDVTPDDIGLKEYMWNGVSILPRTSSVLKKLV